MNNLNYLELIDDFSTDIFSIFFYQTSNTAVSFWPSNFLSVFLSCTTLFSFNKTIHFCYDLWRLILNSQLGVNKSHCFGETFNGVVKRNSNSIFNDLCCILSRLVYMQFIVFLNNFEYIKTKNSTLV